MPGYFSERWSAGVLHPLYARVACFDDGVTKIATVALDVLGIPYSLVKAIRSCVSYKGRIEIIASHTHTGPPLLPICNMRVDKDYIDEVFVPALQEAFAYAQSTMLDTEVLYGQSQEHGLAFCRRYWMKNGCIVTNPPTGHDDIVKPESKPDHRVSVLAFRHKGDYRGMIVHASNHCDSTGGLKLSPDWPGLMAGFVNSKLGTNIPILFFPGTQGDVNHFVPTRGQICSPEIAENLAWGYTSFVLEALERAERLDNPRLYYKSLLRYYPHRDVSEDELVEAGKTVAAIPELSGKTLTSEDLAKGDKQCELFFAKEVLGLREKAKQCSRVPVEVSTFCIGRKGFLFVPFEVFTDLGRRLSREIAGKDMLVTSLSNGMLGYLAPEAFYERGGYETKPTTYNVTGLCGERLLSDQVKRLMS